jgi:hypothetical protein
MPSGWAWDFNRAIKDDYLSFLPSDHPGLKLSYFRMQRGKYPITNWSRNGTPTFIVEYDIKTQKVSPPVS